MSKRDSKAEGSGCLPWVSGLAILGFIASFASDEGVENESLSGDLAEWKSPAPTSDPTVATDVKVPDHASIERASLHAGKVIGALGLEGAENYSELCYASVVDKAELRRLDRCYAFDLFAKRLLETTEGYTPALFVPDVIQARWPTNDMRIAGDSGAMLSRRTAVESASSLMNVAIIPPPFRAPAYSEPTSSWEIGLPKGPDISDSAFEPEIPSEPDPLD